uniref:Uncharacterized protein n=1 Tax=Percolomonas cosmopolitus TaxID=63605 RepID=A0A7S1KUJ4_9EUKA|eukprot:CAMPEP_0117451096 /NCGR_PEP_ID=MMETSP0759-20121206/8821_1 /TAXON_ID=63605 /ORGANISM="Percolomonas cosmopolitus, Strain WS" /LENGTH=262 /DNA_ID=CAMNT_0005243665 /DNA_START=189 /DNA_END=977 /DNA_ORIENTATION=+
MSLTPTNPTNDNNSTQSPKTLSKQSPLHLQTGRSTTSNTFTDSSITPQYNTENEFSPIDPNSDSNGLETRVYHSEDEMDRDLVNGPRFDTSDVNAPSRMDTLTKEIPSPSEKEAPKDDEETYSASDASSSDEDEENLANIKPATWKGWFILKGAKLLDMMDNLGGKVLGNITYMDNPYEDAKYIVEKEREAALLENNEDKSMEIVLEDMREEIMEEVEEGEVRPEHETDDSDGASGTMKDKVPSQKVQQATKVDNPKAAFEV